MSVKELWPQYVLSGIFYSSMIQFFPIYSEHFKNFSFSLKVEIQSSLLTLETGQKQKNTVSKLNKEHSMSTCSLVDNLCNSNTVS